MKTPKTLLLATAFYASLITNSFAASAIGGGSPVVPEGELPYKKFSENSFGAGLSIGARFNLAEDVLLDSEDKNLKTKDHIFTEIEAFGSQFFSGNIKQNFGGRLNLGYEIKGFRIYGSGGYAISTVDYQETGNATQSVSADAPFFGAGLGYDVTKNVGIRLNSMFYNFDFKPKNSGYTSVDVDVVALTLGLAVHF